MQCSIPDTAILLNRVQGTITDTQGDGPSPNDGKQGEVRWYVYGIPSGITYYVEVYVDGVRLLRRSATGRNVAKWRAAFDDMASILV
jgi:hypothetical protein